VTVLITGTAGFVGRHLLHAAVTSFGRDQVLTLSSQPTEICDYVLYDTRPLGIPAKDLEKLNDVDVVIHAGAYTPKTSAEANSIDGCTSNISFTEALLGLPFGRLRKIIYISTLDVYEPAEVTSERTPTNPTTLYGLSKLYCERVVSQFGLDRGLTTQILRLGHIYGPGEQEYRKFLPVAISNILRGVPVEIWGDGEDLRSLLYVGDAVEAIIAAVDYPDDIGVVNVVGGVSRSIREILRQLALVTNRPTQFVSKPYAGPARSYVFDNSKVARFLLENETPLIEGLRREYEYAAAQS
jgi:UDP-glucose 4-epimerase